MDTMDLNEINVFVKVAQAGSFNRAALQLGMPNSTVSAKVSALESGLGVTLLQRTTRKLHITTAGQAFLDRCSAALDELKMARAEVVESQSEPQGALRITAPVELGTHLLPEIISGFIKKYPKVKLDFVLTDKAVELVSEGVDLAVRVGHLKDSSLIAKKIGTVYFALFASPAYIKKNGAPSHPRALAERDCLQFTQIGSFEWALSSSKGSATVRMNGKIVSNDLNMIKALAMASDGIALLPTFLCRSDAEKGKLVQVLPEWRANVRPVHFVYPSQKFTLPKLRAFIAYASDPLRERLREAEG